MENFDRENIDELLEISQIRQYFPPPKICAVRYILVIISKSQVKLDDDNHHGYIQLNKPLLYCFLFKNSCDRVANKTVLLCN